MIRRNLRSINIDESICYWLLFWDYWSVNITTSETLTQLDDIDPQVISRGTFSSAALLISAIAIGFAAINLIPTIILLLQFAGVVKSSTPPSPALMTVAFSGAVVAFSVLSAGIVFLFLKETRKTGELRTELKLLQANKGVVMEQKALNLYLCRVVEYLLYKKSKLVVGDTKEHDRFYISFLNNVKNIFDRVTGAECAVCIKAVSVVDESNEDRELEDGELEDVLYVKTAYRDRASFEDRSGANEKKWYPIKLNTAFYKIISPKHRNNIFIENFLSELAHKGSYNNGNENWHENYKATVVVPIMHPNQKVPTTGNRFQVNASRKVQAFLCVDTKNGKFEKDVSINILRMLSQIVGQVPQEYSSPPLPKPTTSKRKGESNV